MEPDQASMLARRFVDLYFQTGLNARMLNTEVNLPSDFDLGELASRLVQGEPVQYVAGSTYFAELVMLCQKPTLIPRPETEELAYLVASYYLEKESEDFRGLDLCTGSGCLGLGIAHIMELREGEWKGCDWVDSAIELARKNAIINQIEFPVFKLDVLTDFLLEEKQFDCWVANPPYIPPSDKQTVDKQVLNWEDPQALFTPNDDALAFYKAIGKTGLKHIKDGGSLWFECYHETASEVEAFLKEVGYNQAQTLKDYKGANRFVRAIK